MPHGCIKICSSPAYRVGNLVSATPAALASRPDMVTPFGFSLLYRASKASVLMLYATRNSGTCSNASCEQQKLRYSAGFSKTQCLLGHTASAITPQGSNWFVPSMHDTSWGFSRGMVRIHGTDLEAFHHVLGNGSLKSVERLCCTLEL